jgi:hypothetical protein
MSEKPDKEYSTEKEQITLADAKKIWKEMDETKYSDELIKVVVDAASIGAEIGDTPIYTIANALTAQTMIAYNQMIDEKISKAKKSWGIY